jgi:hypothetical protein
MTPLSRSCIRLHPHIRSTMHLRRSTLQCCHDIYQYQLNTMLLKRSPHRLGVVRICSIDCFKKQFLKLNMHVFCFRVMKLVLALILIIVAIFIIVMLMTFVFHVLVFNTRFLVPFTATENLDRHLIASYLYT